jgi:hypothetical protein
LFNSEPSSNLKLSFILLSTSLFTADFNHENEKSNSFFLSRTLGNNGSDFSKIPFFSSLSFNSFSYSFAKEEIIGHHGYPNHIILATLSKASQAASSLDAQIFSILNISSI